MQSRISVALALPVDKTYTYRCPTEFADRALPGCRAVVPFGNRILTGIIVDKPGDELPEERLRDVIDLPDAEPLLSSDLLELTHWISRYYFCSWGEALKAALPAGHLQAGIRIARPIGNPTNHAKKLGKTEQRVLRILQQSGAQSPGALARRHKIPQALKLLLKLEDLGLVRVEQIMPKGGVSVLLQERISPAENVSRTDLLSRAQEIAGKAPRQAQILRAVAEHPEKSWIAAELLNFSQAPRSALGRLIKTGFIKSERVQIKRYPTLETLTLKDEAPLPTPNEDQQKAIETINGALERNEAQTFLLYGVTGSGKTLVYQKVIKGVVASGGSALVLIPEISLTPQIVSRFRACFGDRIGLQHSAMSNGERTDVWRGIRAGEFSIVIGARSAVFAPLKNLRLIIVDEEGDASFKQNEPNPRYNARDVALVRAAQVGAVTVLGSATPSVESFHNAERGRYTLLELPSRVDGVPAPSIRFTTPPKTKGKVFGTELERAVVGRVQLGEQAILLLNRRGFFTFIFCPQCGHILRCRHCEITLTYHRKENLLRCHICGYRISPPRTCPECGKLLKYAGTGTQRVEEELAGLIPRSKMTRLDLDTTRRRGSHHRILKGFAREEQAILLGTKMVARGHDYPQVTLVGVVSADVELAFPDFRCDERTFTLLLQAAGRAGRSPDSGQPGEVLIQTWMPDHPILKLVEKGDYRAFYQREIELRRSLNYPPLGWMILFIFSSRDFDRAQKAARGFITKARSQIKEGEWMGPTAAFRSRLKDKHRLQVVLKTGRQQRSIRSKVHEKLGELIEEIRNNLPKTVHVAVDVDPIQLL